jgi:hypothetical protein
MTTIDGLASARPSLVFTFRCSSAKSRDRTPLRDQRRNWDHTPVQGPNCGGRQRYWHPVWAM